MAAIQRAGINILEGKGTKDFDTAKLCFRHLSACLLFNERMITDQYYPGGKGAYSF